MFSHARPKFTAPAYQDLLNIFSQLADNPVSSSETWPPYFIPPVQSAVLAALPTVLPPPTPACWNIVLDFLCTQLAPPHLPALPPPVLATTKAEAAAAPAADVACSQAAATQELLIRRIWMRDVSEKMLVIYKAHMPWEVRAQSFQRLVAAMRPGIALRWEDATAEEVSKGLVRDFCALANMGLPSVHIATVQDDSSHSAEVRLCAAVLDGCHRKSKGTFLGGSTGP
jgi:hypothetical protein